MAEDLFPWTVGRLSKSHLRVGLLSHEVRVNLDLNLLISHPDTHVRLHLHTLLKADRIVDL